MDSTSTVLTSSLKAEYMSLFNQINIGSVGRSSSLREEKYKMVVLAAFLYRVGSMPNMQSILMTMCKIRGLNYNLMPDFPGSILGLNMSTQFFYDYSKIQYLYENNKYFSLLYNLLYETYMKIGPYSEESLCVSLRAYDLD